MDLKEKIESLPKTPGIYMMKDKYGDIIYVGKSKKLKDRVKSYFVNSKNYSRKVKRMVNNICDIDFANIVYSYIKSNKNINYKFI